MIRNKIKFAVLLLLATKAYAADLTIENYIKNQENLLVAKMNLTESEKQFLKESVDQLSTFDDKRVFLTELSRLSTSKNFNGLSKESVDSFQKLGRPHWQEAVTKAIQFFYDETLYANTFYYFCKSYKIVSHKHQILLMGKNLCAHLNIKDNLEQALFLQALTTIKEKNLKKFESHVIRALKDQEQIEKPDNFIRYFDSLNNKQRMNFSYESFTESQEKRVKIF